MAAGCPADRSPSRPRRRSTPRSPLLRNAERTAVELIKTHLTELKQLVDLLLLHETVDGSEVYRIVGRPVPGGHRPDLAVAPVAGGQSIASDAAPPFEG